MTTTRASILLVDDEEKILKALGRALRDAGHRVTDTTSSRQGYGLPATPESERPQIIMMTAHATIESAIAAMKLGEFSTACRSRSRSTSCWSW